MQPCILCHHTAAERRAVVRWACNGRLWERRLIGDSVWLIKAYAAWCPACKAHMPQFHAAAELLRDSEEVALAAILTSGNMLAC